MPARRRRLAAIVVAVLTVALLTAGGVGVPATATVLPTAAGNAAATGRDKPTIVLGHGVFAGASGWSVVAAALQAPRTVAATMAVGQRSAALAAFRTCRC